MATLTTLTASGALVAIDPWLGPREQPWRRIFATPNVIDWLDNQLPSLEPVMADPLMTGGRMDPVEQIDHLFHEFVSGKDLSYYQACHIMSPATRGIWELKTTDLRLFGWFPAKDAFIVAEIESAARLKSIPGLYGGYRDSAVRQRDAMDLDEPKAILGTEYIDVLSS